jgi:hypothetical protein
MFANKTARCSTSHAAELRKIAGLEAAKRWPPRARPRQAAEGGPGRGNRTARRSPGTPRRETSADPQPQEDLPQARSPRHDPAGGHLPEEMVGGFKCKHCGWPGWREHRVVTKEGAHHATLAFAGCTNCGTLHPTHVGSPSTPTTSTPRSTRNVKSRVKKIERPDRLPPSAWTCSRPSTPTDTAAVELDDEGVGHRQGCPRGGDAPCGPEKAGRCTLCNYRVQDHEALGKTDAIDARATCASSQASHEPLGLARTATSPAWSTATRSSPTSPATSDSAAPQLRRPAAAGRHQLPAGAHRAGKGAAAAAKQLQTSGAVHITTTRPVQVRRRRQPRRVDGQGDAARRPRRRRPSSSPAATPSRGTAPARAPALISAAKRAYQRALNVASALTDAGCDEALPSFDVDRDFDVFCDVTKATTLPDGRRLIRGVASGVLEDRDGERVSARAIADMAAQPATGLKVVAGRTTAELDERDRRRRRAPPRPRDRRADRRRDPPARRRGPAGRQGVQAHGVR